MRQRGLLAVGMLPFGIVLPRLAEHARGDKIRVAALLGRVAVQDECVMKALRRIDPKPHVACRGD